MQPNVLLVIKGLQVFGHKIKGGHVERQVPTDLPVGGKMYIYLLGKQVGIMSTIISSG